LMAGCVEVVVEASILFTSLKIAIFPLVIRIRINCYIETTSAS